MERPSYRALLPALAALLAAASEVGCHHRLPSVAPASETPVGFTPPMVYPDIDWKSSLEEARALSADEHKPLVIFVRAAWSKASVIMDSTVWKDERVLSQAGRFICARVDLTPEYGDAIPDTLKALDVSSVPTTLIVTTDGRVVGRFISGTAHASDVAAAMKAAQLPPGPPSSGPSPMPAMPRDHHE